MEQRKKQDISTGNGAGKPILAGSQNTGEASKLSPKSTKIGQGSTKPVSLPEALSLLQTLCLDLRSLDCETAILARNNRLYVVISTPSDTGKLSFSGGHIMLNNQPVSEINTEKVTSRLK